MEKNKFSKKVVVGVVLILIAGVFIFSRVGNTDNKFSKNEGKFLGPQTPPPTDLKPDVPLGEVKKVQNVTSEAKDMRPMIEMEVLGQEYNIPIKPGETLKNAMDNFENQNNGFTFSGREMLGVGFFVEEINGVKNGGGLYWVYYLNDVSATVGVSSQYLSGGENIRWERRVPGDY
jgi:hypothetical protein